MPKLFRHEAPALTVGELRAKLADLPDDTPVKVAVPDALPGTRRHRDGLVDDRYTVIEVGFGVAEWPDGRTETDNYVTIEIDHQTGDYDDLLTETS